MGKIIAIGEKKQIRGKWYRKDESYSGCRGCAFRDATCPGCDISKAVEDGGSECLLTIWTRLTPKAPKAPANPEPSKVVWSKKFLSIHPKATKADLMKRLQETVDQLNDIGAKWAKAQNTINTLKKKATK